MLQAVPIPVITFNDVITQDNPIRWYRFNEASGSTLIDYGSNHVNGVYEGDPAFTVRGFPSLRIGNPASCGYYHLGRLASASMPTLGTEWTIEAIGLRALLDALNNVPGQYDPLVGSYLNYAGDCVTISYDPDISFLNVIKYVFANQQTQASTIPTRGGITQAAITFNAGVYKLYNNGVLISTYSNSTVPFGSLLEMGGSQGPSGYFCGVMSDVIVYDHEVSAARMALHYGTLSLANNDPFYDKICVFQRYDDIANGVDAIDFGGVFPRNSTNNFLSASNPKWGAGSQRCLSGIGSVWRFENGPSIAAHFNTINELSIENWVYLSSFPNRANLFYLSGTIICQINAISRILEFSLSDGLTTYTVTGVTPVPLGTYAFLQFIRTPTSMRVALNGLVDASILVPSGFLPVVTTTDRIQMFDENDFGGSTMDGYVDSTRITFAARPVLLPTADFPYP